MTKKTKTNAKSSKKRKTKTRSNKSFIELLKSNFDKNPHKVYSIKRLFKNLKVRHKSAKVQLVDDLEKLTDAGFIVMDSNGDFRRNIEIPSYEGVVDFVNPRFAFIICDDLENDIWVDSRDLKFALDGDRVRVQVTGQGRGDRLEGKVEEVLERRRNEFVGKIEMSERFAFVVADNKKMHLDIFIPQKGIKNAQRGDKVVVKIVEWHTAKNSPVGVVKEVLGQAGTHETEMHAILAEFDLPITFPEDVLNESNRIRSRVTKTEIAKRRDMRNTTTFTIDPADAKDFDDALSIRPIGDKRWEVGIHIADVTHYVRPNTALEKEAQARATSVYLVDRVVPMLPEKLSNDLCSLRPNEDRLTFSAIFELDEKGKVYKEWFGRTVIHSDRRFDYEEAQTIIEKGKGDFADELQLLNRIAKELTKERFRRGAINFETTEVKFKLDEKGKPVGIYTKERKDTHKMIEEFMLLANRKVAEFIYKQQPGKQPKTMVYRIHEKPDSEKLANFSTFAKKFGYDIATQGKAMASSINRLIERSGGTPQQNILQSLAIRTMAKARYSTEIVGHFGLAFEHYTHFTSPIRRYPDMMVHRLLQRYLDGKRSESREEYEQKCKHSSDMEKRAADAERASIKYKQVEYMELVEDKAYPGVVTGVTEWGVYVEMNETKCEGMIRMTDIVDDFYELDSENYRLIGKRYKRIIAFGDDVVVRVKDTNLERRTIDLVFAD